MEFIHLNLSINSEFQVLTHRRVVCRMGLSDHDPRPLSFQELGGEKKKWPRIVP